jgi:thiol:disulfide interchange protein DsbD
MKIKTIILCSALSFSSAVVTGPTIIHSMTVTKKEWQQKTQDVSLRVKTSLQGAASQGSWAYVLLLAFLSGILVSFTPCVYPMIPVTVGILQSQAVQSAWRNFGLTMSYVFGIATVHAVLGYLAATTSMIFGQWLSNPWFILFIILFFLYFAFSMFGFYEIYMPKFLLSGSGVQAKGSFFGSFIFGLISGTVASPCLTPVLAFLLGFVAKIANPVLGFLTLFVFALGMGMILIIVGSFSGVLSTLPKAGQWMDEIKKVFGFAMLAACIYVAQPVLASWLAWLLYAVLALFFIGYFAFRFLKKDTPS